MKLLRMAILVRKLLAPTYNANAQLIISDHTPTRGEAANDETSFQAEQQNWGPERADVSNLFLVITSFFHHVLGAGDLFRLLRQVF